MTDGVLDEWARMLTATLSAAGRETSSSANALARLQSALLTVADVLRQSDARALTGRTAGTAGSSAIAFSQGSFAAPVLPLSLAPSGSLAVDRTESLSPPRAFANGTGSGLLSTANVGRGLRAANLSPVTDGSNAVAFRELRLEGEATFAALGRASDSASRRIVRGFAAAFGAGRTFQDVVRELAIDLSEVGLRSFVLRPLEQGVSQGVQLLAGPIASAFGGIAGRAEGGPVSAGKPFVVGERGPELFVPNQGGSIVPSAGPVTQHITVNVDGGINNAGRKTPGQVGALIAREAARQSRRNN